MNVTTGQRTEAPPTFEEHVRDVVRRLRAALTGLVSVLGADPTNARGMARQFGFNKNLAWRVSKIVCSTNPIAAVPCIPGRSGCNILLRALTEAGAPVEQVALLRRTLNEFETLIKVHSVDRETLEMMLNNLTQEGQRERDETHRKLAYRGNSAIWGVRAAVQFNCHLLAPNQDASLLDHGRICGLVDFQRLRSNVAWAVSQIARIAGDGTWHSVKPTAEPIDPAINEPGRVPLLTRFCSQPLPETRVVPGRGDSVRHEIVGGPVGATAALTCVTAWCEPGFSPNYPDDRTVNGLSAMLTTPVEWLVLDVLVHKDLRIRISREPLLCNELPGGPPYSPAEPEQGLLPLCERVQELGRPADLATPELPRCAEMVRVVCEQRGWSPDDFEGFRLRLRYPPIPTLVTIPIDVLGE